MYRYGGVDALERSEDTYTQTVVAGRGATTKKRMRERETHVRKQIEKIRKIIRNGKGR